MTNRYAVLLGATLLLAVAGCKKDDDPVLPPASVGGKGGSGTLRVTPRHHGKQIDSCTVFIKYNAVDKPANGVYDDSVKCIKSGGIPVATFTSLKKGNYYLFGYGWDPELSPPAHVRGGYAYPLSVENDQSVELAVSEE